MIFRSFSKAWRPLVLACGVGAGVMAVEIIASRLLAPHFGTSLFVWTSLILTVLVALAFGYWFGGVAAERGAKYDFLAAILLGAAVCLLLGIWFGGRLAGGLSSAFVGWSDASAALFVGSLLAASAMLALPVLLLGMAGPILVQLLSDQVGVGRASGRYLAWSTIGSVIGTVTPTLVLVPNFGSRLSLSLVALLFVVLAVFAARSRPVWLVGLALLPLLMLTAGWVQAAPPTLLAERESPYQLIRIWGLNGWRYLTFNEGSGVQSVRPPADEPTGMYYDFVGLLPKLRPGTGGEHRGAIIGLCGGTAVRSYRSFVVAPESVKLVGVELDESVLALGQEHLGLDPKTVDITVADGRQYLLTTSLRFDSLLVDAYGTQLYIPPHLASREFFTLAKSRLRDGGVLALNLNATDVTTPLFRAMTNTLAAVFDEVVAVPVPNSWNWLIFASDEPLDVFAAAADLPPGYHQVTAAAYRAQRVGFSPQERVFTDDWSPVEFMTETMIVGEALNK